MSDSSTLGTTFRTFGRKARLPTSGRSWTRFRSTYGSKILSARMVPWLRNESGLNPNTSRKSPMVEYRPRSSVGTSLAVGPNRVIDPSWTSASPWTAANGSFFI